MTTALGDISWLKLLPLLWVGASMTFCALTWRRFGSLLDGALYYDPLASALPRGFSAKLIGVSSAVAIDASLVKVRMSFVQSVVFFFGRLHRDIIIKRAQIKSASMTSLFFQPAVEIAYDDDHGPTTMKLRVRDPNRVLMMLSNVGPNA